MVVRLLAKLGVASSTISSVVYLDVVSSNFGWVRSKEETKQVTEELRTIEDIELFEKLYGCNFIFVNHWDNGLLYSARKFEEENSKDWKEKIFESLNKLEEGKAKKICKESKGVITLFDDRKNNKFRLGVPDNGRW